MTLTILKGDRVPIKIWADLAELESEAIDQLKNVAKMPWVYSHVAAMPDVHTGIGATIGSVIAMKGAVAPSAVGVDIGCGMAAMRTSLMASELPESLRELRQAFERAIPVGFHEHAAPVRWIPAEQLFATFRDLDRKVWDLESKAKRQLGTLGSGNHFIELCLDESRRVWVMLHSGSRNVGKELAETHIARAKRLTHNVALADRNLAVFLEGSPEFEAYQHDLFWAQSYARENRAVMLQLLKVVLSESFPDILFDEPITCHHNYVAVEEHFGEKVFVTRKGAIRARKEEMGIIPGSMGTKSYIVRGLGNLDSFESASHGAGRRMSRSKAKKTFSAADMVEQTKDVECRKDPGVIDEIPGAYKDIDHVMANQRDLVEIVHTLKQVICIKG